VSAIAVLSAERIKLSTTRAPLWCAITVAVLSLAVAAVQGSTAYGAAALPPEKAAIGVVVFGVPVLMILAALTVTGEYGSGMIRTTFAATPNRTLVLVAKGVVAAVFSGAYAAVMVIAAIVVARLAAPPLIGSQPVTEPDTWRTVGAVALYAAVAAVLGVAVGALLRASAGAVALLLLWPLVVEPMLGNLPNVGSEVGPYLPFANAFLFTRVAWLFPVYDMGWGELGSLLYFTAVAAVVFLAALVVTDRRDA
jgi:ABC-2 type transport system permease protein